MHTSVNGLLSYSLFETLQPNQKYLRLRKNEGSPSISHFRSIVLDGGQGGSTHHTQHPNVNGLAERAYSPLKLCTQAKNFFGLGQMRDRHPLTFPVDSFSWGPRRIYTSYTGIPASMAC